MTVNELQIQLDISTGNELGVLSEHAYETSNGSYFFVDSSNGQCYLFDKYGKQDDISKAKRIEDYAFWNCRSLKSIIIPGSVESIGEWAFYNCISLMSIAIPDSVERIGDHAFYYCKSLESIMIPDSVESIGNGAFANCTSLENMVIPSSVKNIGKLIFAYCKSLKEVVFKGNTIDYVKEMDNYLWGIKDTSIIRCR